jgi:hypothetical protein
LLARKFRIADYEGFYDLLATPEHIENWNEGYYNGGHQYSLQPELPGGTGDAMAGHGVFHPMRVEPLKTIIPEGTMLSFWSKHNREMPDYIGRLIERGDYETLYYLFKTNDKIERFLTGAHSKLLGAEVYNYTFRRPVDLKIHKNSMTIGNDAQLSDLLGESMGCLNWAACTTSKWE